MNSTPRFLHVAFCSALLFAGALGQSATYAQDESDPEALFKKAMKSRATGELQESIEAFQSILSIEPALHRARLELATTYFQAQNYAEARKQAQRVLDNPDTPEAVKTDIRRFLAEIGTVDIRHHFSPYVHLGALYNSNVNSGPGSNIFQGIVLAPGTTKENDHALTLSAGLAHSYMAPSRVKLGSSDASFSWSSYAAFYRADYDKFNAYDLDVLSLGTGPGLYVAGKWRGGINVHWDESRLGGDRYASYLGLKPSFTHISNRGNTEVTGDASIQKRTFHRASENGRDSQYASVGVSVGQVVGMATAIQAGANYFTERADANYYSNKGYEVFAGVKWQVTKPLSVFGRLSYRDTQYDAAEPFLAVARDENTLTATLGVTYKFLGTVLDQWEIGLNYIYADNRSNIGLYSFDREQINLTFGRSF